MFFCRPPAYAAIETVVVTASPLSGFTIDPDKVPGEVQTVSVSEQDIDRQADVLPNLLATQLPDVSLNNEQGSQFQPDFVYRGFEASPISGVAEGVAVYQNGVRLNEAFGDGVNWDLVPEFAVNSLTLESGNPVFGLNALGGAVSLDMKDGFSFQGAQAQVSGGSYGNIGSNAQYGAQWGNVGLYAGVSEMHDDGFRDQSPTQLQQAYADLGYEDAAPRNVHLSLGGALNTIDAVGPTPVQLLAQDPRSVFTYPQAISNEMELAQLPGSYILSDDWTASGSAYYRHFDQHLIDGNTTDVVACKNDPAQFCLEGHNKFPGDALYDEQGNPVPVSALPAGATPGETDHTMTDTQGFGAAFELSSKVLLFGHVNNFVAGASFDHGDTDYTAYGELGALLPNLRVAGAGIVIDQANNPTAKPPIEEPVSVNGTNAYTGIYALDAFDITPALTWTLSGRLNIADITLHDQIGTALEGHHDFTRFNPGTGLTYKLAPFATAYAGYSESNRAPTAGELSCANPKSPCLLDTFLVSDPSLKQVVSRNYEGGLRGKFPGGDGTFDWNLGVYRDEVADDILFALHSTSTALASSRTPAPRAIRVWTPASDTPTDRWHLGLAYSYLDATFRNALTLSSDSPAANGDGNIFVKPGDALPLMPRNRVTLTGEYLVTTAWRVGADLRVQSGSYLADDQSNQEPKLPGYTTVDLHSSYKITNGFELFGEVENLFDRYYTYGTFTELDGLPPNFNLTNPRTYSPAIGRVFYGGVRVKF